MATPPDFTAGQVLTAAQMNGIGLWLVKTHTIPANVASTIISAAFSADYSNYLLVFNQLDSFSGNQFVTAQLRVGSTTTTTGYYSGGYTTSSYAGSLGTSFVNNASAWNAVGCGTSGLGSGHMWVFNPFEAVPTGYSASYAYESGTGQLQGYQSSSTSFDQLVLVGGSANLNGGTVTIYGAR
jgi:hypothetical protein